MQVRRWISPAFLGRFATVFAVAIAIAAVPAQAHAASAVRLMVDPGHGGSDPGAVGGDLREKDSNLRIGKMVVESARRQGWTVATTRNDDRAVDLVERPRRAARFKANALVSVHSNSTGAKALGNMTIYRTASGARLGNSIMKELAPLTPYPDLGNRQDVRGLAVLREARMPSVVVELMSVTAASENRTLKNPVAQRQMAEAVVRGIAKYYNVKYYPPAMSKAVAKPKAAPKAAPKPAPKAEPTATPKAKPTAAPKPETKPKVDPVAKLDAVPKVESLVSRPTKAEPAQKMAPAYEPAPTSAEVKAKPEAAPAGARLLSFVWRLLFSR